MNNLVKRVQEVSAGHTDEKIHYPFVIQSKQQTLPDSWPSPIYSSYRAGVCKVKVQQRKLHEEIFSDLYGIEFSKKWLGQKAAGLDDIVIRFPEKVSDKDPNYFTHHYIKSCLVDEPKVMDRIQTENHPMTP